MKLSIRDLNLKNQRVLVRVDFNVPLNADGSISDDTRIRAALPTIQYILSQGAKVILMSHLGRPDGKRDMRYSLAPCAERLSILLKQPVLLATDCIGPQVEEQVHALKTGHVLMLENLRFHAAEEAPSSEPNFAKQLAKLADVYVNDAFGTAHRSHSSTATITQYFPGKAAAGFLMAQEIEFLHAHFTQPQHPFYAIIGGAKVSTKMGILRSLLAKVDALFIGGGMAYTFLKAQGCAIGLSICENHLLESAKQFLEEAKNRKISIYLPQDLVIADQFSEQAATQTVSCQKGIPAGWQGMDIGPQTASKWVELLQKARMVFWNGPLGVFEMTPFAKGTQEIAQALAQNTGITIIGGGDTVAAINQMGLTTRFTHISTGGGASLEYIEYGHLPGIDALSDSLST